MFNAPPGIEPLRRKHYSLTSPQWPPWGQKKVAIVERFKQEPMYGLSANKSGVGESSTVLLTALGDRDSEKNFLLRTSGRLLTDCTLFIAKGGGTSF